MPFYKSPSPADYPLRSLTGYHGHEVSSKKMRAPQWTFGSAGTRFQKYPLNSPGPAAYGERYLNQVTRFGKPTQISHTLGSRHKDARMLGNPGPIYAPINPVIYRERRSPAHIFGIKLKGPRQDNLAPKQVPPVPLDLYKRKAPAFVMGYKIPTRRGIPSGGNDDGFLKKHLVLKSTPAFTFGSKLQTQRYKASPPIQSLQFYDPYPKGPAFSFGVKHSEYTQNPIVPCDNYWR